MIMKLGDIAQLIECFHGMEEVEGLSPSISTKKLSMTKKKQSTNNIYELIGWAGTVLLLLGYALLSLGLISGDSYTYHVFALFGSLFIAIISYRKRVMQPAVLNAIFSCLAVVAIGRIMFLL